MPRKYAFAVQRGLLCLGLLGTMTLAATGQQVPTASNRLPVTKPGEQVGPAKHSLATGKTVQGKRTKPMNNAVDVSAIEAAAGAAPERTPSAHNDGSWSLRNWNQVSGKGDGGIAGVGCVGCTDMENEPDCGGIDQDPAIDTVNGGCNSEPPVFSAISCGQTVCGTAGSTELWRDTDWWKVTLTEPQILTWTVTAEFPVLIGFVGQPCPQSAFMSFNFGGECAPVTVMSSCLPAGEYVCFVAPDGVVVPCGAKYTGTLTCTPCTITTAPDNCADAQLLNCGDVVSTSNFGATNDGLVPSCSFQGAPTNSDVWFKFVASQNAAIVSLCSNPGLPDTVVSLYSGTCAGGLTEVACNDDFCGATGLVSEVTALNLNIGETYYIRVASWFDAPQGTFDISLTCFTVTCPSCTDTENEPDCGGIDQDPAVDTVNGGCNSTPPVFSTITCGETVCGTAGANALWRDTDWWKVTLTEPMILTWTVDAEFDSLVGFIAQPCPQTAFMGAPAFGSACMGPVTVISNCLLPGEYVCFVAPTAITPCGAKYTGTLTCTPCVPPPPPDNDNCVDAQLLSCGDLVAGTNLGATLEPSPGTPTCSFAGAPVNSDVWYKFIATQAGATVSLCNNPGLPDTVLAMYEGTCGSLVQIGCNDDFCGPTGLVSQLTQGGLSVGQTYYIRVASWNQEAQGNFDISLTCFTPPANDTCSGAQLLECGVTTPATNVGATDDGLLPSCSFFGAPTNSDVWFKFVAAGSTATISLCDNPTITDTVMTVYSGNCGELIEVACNDDFCGPTGLVSEVTAMGLISCNTYYVRVGGWNLEPQNPFNILVTCGDPEGSCCLNAGGCTMTTEAGCPPSLGVWTECQQCSQPSFVVANCGSALDDISATGTISTVSGTDDGSQSGVPIGFSFPYFGNNYTTVEINNNGFISFDINGDGWYTNGAIPSASAPNNLIAPMWDDFYTVNQGSVTYQTLASPTRFVVQWTNTQRFPGEGPGNTFQAILYPSGAIDFRYGSIEGTPILTPTVGVENATGLAGTTVSAADLGAGNACRNLQFVTPPDICEDCLGDTNNDGVVNVDDLVNVILQWGCTGSCPADTNNDGVVDVDDLVNVILDWNCGA